MNSVAVWSNKNIELELHINVWDTLKRITWYKKNYNKFANLICALSKINEFSNYIYIYLQKKNNTTILYRKILDYELEYKEAGTIFKFKINKSKNNKEFYYSRFRINKIYDLIKEINANFSWLDWYVDKKAVVEFSVNHKRKIPYNIEFKDNVNFNIANIFLLTNEVYKKISNAKAYVPNFEGWYY